jgi:hypothetical protein
MHLVSCGGKGQGLLPDPPVERYRKILDEDEDMRPPGLATHDSSLHRNLQHLSTFRRPSAGFDRACQRRAGEITAIPDPGALGIIGG